MAGEESDCFEEIVHLFYSAGYWKAMKSELKPFDVLTGGLSWVISAANVEIGIELEYDEDLTLGEKIEIGEAIEKALLNLNCPYLLQSHQIRGLDYPAILKVVKWLVEKALSQRRELAQELAWVTYQVRSKRNVVEKNRAKLEEKRDKINLKKINLMKTKERETTLSAKLSHLREELSKEEASRKLPEVIESLQEIENLKETESQLKKSCGDHLAELDSHIADLESQLERERHISHAELAERRSELEKRHLLANEKLATLKKILSEKLRSIGEVQRALSQIPSQTEILQYEKRYTEIFEQIERQESETRLHFSNFNFLVEALKLTNKESTLLESLNTQLQGSKLTSTVKRNLAVSLDQTIGTVLLALEKVEKKLKLEKEKKEKISNEVLELEKHERKYFEVLREIQDECARIEEDSSNSK